MEKISRDMIRRREQLVDRLYRERDRISDSEWVRIMSIRYEGLSIKSVPQEPGDDRMVMGHDIVIYRGTGTAAADEVLGAGPSFADAIRDAVDFFLMDLTDDIVEIEEALDGKEPEPVITEQTRDFLSMYKHSDN